MKRAPKKCETPTAPTYTEREKREKRETKKADKLFEGTMAENFHNLLENNRFN